MRSAGSPRTVRFRADVFRRGTSWIDLAMRRARAFAIMGGSRTARPPLGRELIVEGRFGDAVDGQRRTAGQIDAPEVETSCQNPSPEANCADWASLRDLAAPNVILNTPFVADGHREQDDSMPAANLIAETLQARPG